MLKTITRKDALQTLITRINHVYALVKHTF